METDDFYISTKHCTTDKSALLSIHEPLLHLDDDSILEGQLLCFNQKLDLLCSISVINWLIISGLLPLNYGADCKWNGDPVHWKWPTQSGTPLADFYRVWWQPTLCCGCPKDVEKIFPCLAPFYHTFIILLERHRKLVMYVQSSTVIGFSFIQRQFWLL